MPEEKKQPALTLKISVRSHKGCRNRIVKHKDK